MPPSRGKIRFAHPPLFAAARYYSPPRVHHLSAFYYPLGPRQAERGPALIFATMLRLLVASCAVATAHAALELTPDNWDTEVVQSGKAAFIKFLAPW